MKRSLKLSQCTRGFTLVEVMVGLVIGLIGSLVIFQVFAVSESYKRTSTSGGDAQQNGAISLYAIERDVRLAGYGVTALMDLGCTIQGYDEQLGTPITVGPFRPVVITDGAGGAPDTIEILYGNTPGLSNPVKLTQKWNGIDAQLKVGNRYGFQPGNLVVVTEPTAAPAKDCSLAQVTDVPGTPGKTDEVIHNSGNYKDPAGNTVASRYNKPGGLKIPYEKDTGLVYNIGSLPTWERYSIAGSRLMFEDLFNPGLQEFSDGIVNLQAQYGKDTDDNGVIDTWDETIPADWKQLIAVRIAVVARSGQYEKEMVTAKDWSLFGGAIMGTLADEERHYRYKVFDTLVPIRNSIWRP